MKLILTSRALRYSAPAWAASSLKQAVRTHAVSVTQISTGDRDWEGEAPASMHQSTSSLIDQSLRVSPTTEKISKEANVTLPKPLYTSWQRRILELNQPNKVVIEDADQRGILVAGEPHELDNEANLSTGILPHLDRRLHMSENHPLAITKSLVESVFQPPKYRNYVHLNPVVTTAANFDVLGFPRDHPGRSKTDTYYVNKERLLRTHTSAHQDELFRAIGKADETETGEHSGFTLIADVFRRDSIDRSHYPVFHQMEGAMTWKIDSNNPDACADIIRKDLEGLGKANLEVLDVESFSKTNPMQEGAHRPGDVDLVARHLKASLEHLVVKVITAAREAHGEAGSTVEGEPIKARWVEAYFPFTAPSYELEVWWKGEWLELLGCGVVQQKLLDNAGISDRIGWAWGIGIERLAMLLFGIPDIRLFWSEDQRFLNQFKKGTVTEFKPFSRFPTCFKDVAFWIDASKSTIEADPTPPPLGAADVNPGPAAAAPAGGHSNPLPNDPPPPSSDSFHENDLMEIVRDIAGSLVEDVRLVDDFKHPKTGRRSLCYRINYRSLERTLTNEETNVLHQRVTEKLKDIGLKLR